MVLNSYLTHSFVSICVISPPEPPPSFNVTLSPPTLPFRYIVLVTASFVDAGSEKNPFVESVLTILFISYFKPSHSA